MPFPPLSTGIFAYMNYRVPRTRKEIFETLIKGLQRLEYRGYDSAGRCCRSPRDLGYTMSQLLLSPVFLMVGLFITWAFWGALLNISFQYKNKTCSLKR
jgi:hypothetical protein